MEVPRTARRSDPLESHQPLASQPSSDEDITSPLPSFTEVINMLKTADVTVGTQYKHIPQLRDELRQQFSDGIGECNIGKRDHVTLLLTRLRQERKLFDSYNRYRLGNKSIQSVLDEDIQEDLESFPLRLEVVERGFDALTLHLRPIYKSANVNAAPITQQIKDSQPETPTSGATLKTKNKTGRKVLNYNKLQDAAPPNLEFPRGNILITELAAFHPEAIKSWDVIDRVCGNGLGQFIYTHMMNHYREMSRGKITNNSVYRMFKGPITKRAKAESGHQPPWEDWTPVTHGQYHDATNFNPASVSVTDFRAAADGKNSTTAAPIPMKNLAIGVKVFPSGNDALDLTRAVQYCVDHPDEAWYYPADYERLVNKLGGPATVRTAHTDAEIVARWMKGLSKTGETGKTSGRKRDTRDRLQKVDSDDEQDFDAMDEIDSGDYNKGKKRKCPGFFDDSDDSDDVDTPSCKQMIKRTKIAQKSRASRDGKRAVPGPSGLRKQLTVSDIDSDSESDGYAGPKSHKKKKAQVLAPRRSARPNKFKDSFIMNDGFEDEDIEPAEKLPKPDIIAKYGIHATRAPDMSSLAAAESPSDQDDDEDSPISDGK